MAVAPVPDGLAAADERSHPPGDDPAWGESWSFWWWTPDAALGGYVRIGFLPHLGACWYWAALAGAGRPTVLVVDQEVPPPRRPTLEVRHHGLWADHTVEVPFDHVTLGCEAFALGLDDPHDAWRRPLLGDRLPFGLGLEWETDGPAVVGPAGGEWGGYDLPCLVHGEVLVADERIEVDATGSRRHAWGVERWWDAEWMRLSGRLDDGSWCGVEAELGHDLQVPRRPMASAPVLVEAPDGRAARLDRVLCRFTDPATGLAGAGWMEANDPPAAASPTSP
jgi:hypothetical protein